MDSPTFPQEIFDTVIDFGHDDDSFLAACGLVCTGWVASSRHHLFETIELNDKNKQTWVEIVNSALATVLPHVRVVYLDGTLAPSNQIHHLGFFLPCFANLNVTSVHLCFLRIPSDIFLIRGPICRRIFQNVVLLELDNIIADSWDEVFYFISTFNFLSSLILRPTTWVMYRASRGQQSQITPAHCAPPVLSLVHLDLHSNDMEDVLYWLSSSSSITSVRLVRLMKGSYATSQSFLDGLSSGLEELDIQLYRAPIDEESEYGGHASQALDTLLDLSSYQRLWYLKLNLDCWGFWQAPWMLNCLFNMPRNIQHLTFFIARPLAYALIDSNEPMFPWVDLEIILSTVRFPSLRVIEFALGLGKSSPVEHLQEVQAFIHRNFKGGKGGKDRILLFTVE
ncbi:hypothetical protein C8J56DRAFT_1158557 [Mycena floridula]|nr:hypothetical protein C8J56DRAFT_1158557 [Mycena floridula]